MIPPSDADLEQLCAYAHNVLGTAMSALSTTRQGTRFDDRSGGWFSITIPMVRDHLEAGAVHGELVARVTRFDETSMPSGHQVLTSPEVQAILHSTRIPNGTLADDLLRAIRASARPDICQGVMAEVLGVDGVYAYRAPAGKCPEGWIVRDETGVTYDHPLSFDELSTYGLEPVGFIEEANVHGRVLELPGQTQQLGGHLGPRP